MSDRRAPNVLHRPTQLRFPKAAGWPRRARARRNYVYIVSDFTPLASVIKNDSVLTQAPDAHASFAFLKKHNAYVVTMTFQKLIGDAKKRNRVWFKTLGIE